MSMRLLKYIKISNWTTNTLSSAVLKTDLVKIIRTFKESEPGYESNKFDLSAALASDDKPIKTEFDFLSVG